MNEIIDTFDILMDAPFTLAKAKKLKQIASDLEGINKDIGNQISLIEGCWKGQSSDAMKEKLSSAKNYNKQIIGDLNEVSDRITRIVNNILDADNAAVQRIKSMDK